MAASKAFGKFDLGIPVAKETADKVCGRAPQDVDSDPSATSLGLAEKTSYGYEQVISHLRDFFAKYGKHMDLVGRFSTISSVLKTVFPRKMWFVGFYTVVATGKSPLGLPYASSAPKEDDWALVVGPYQGTVLACGHIHMGKGVCGSAASERKTQVVRDVKLLDNYIACDDETRSEIVVPVFLPAARDGASSGETKAAAGGGSTSGSDAASTEEWREGERLCAVLDIDGEEVGSFTEIDAHYLQGICREFVTKWAASAPAGAGAVGGYTAL